jgi:hemolysin activation/secretion protein
LGGEPSIRGFRDDSLQGDSGFCVRNDLSVNLARLFSSQNKLLAAFTPGLFFDYGQVYPNSRLRQPGALAGAGAKLSFRYGMVDASLTWARVMQKANWMTENSTVYFNLGLSKRF